MSPIPQMLSINSSAGFPLLQNSKGSEHREKTHPGSLHENIPLVSLLRICSKKERKKDTVKSNLAYHSKNRALKKPRIPVKKKKKKFQS